MNTKEKNSNLKPIIIISTTVLALIAFAANSVLCRFALGKNLIDAASFTSVRLISGAVMLTFVALFSKEKLNFTFKDNFFSSSMLFIYAVTFSFAYINLSTGTGALILFGAVQLTMIISALFIGERPNLFEWAGLIMALAGLVYLVSPGLTAPSIGGSVLMLFSGIAWGIYSLRGRRNKHPLISTANNFILSVPFVIVISIIFFSQMNISSRGFLLALTSGAVTSGLGYAIWYVALRGLTATRAATVQLSVPIIAAIGGVMFLTEEISLRLIIASLLILGGIGMAIVVGKKKKIKI